MPCMQCQHDGTTRASCAPCLVQRCAPAACNGPLLSLPFCFRCRPTQVPGRPGVPGLLRLLAGHQGVCWGGWGLAAIVAWPCRLSCWPAYLPTRAALFECTNTWLSPARCAGCPELAGAPADLAQDGVHFTLCGGTVCKLGTEKHHRWGLSGRGERFGWRIFQPWGRSASAACTAVRVHP